MQHDDSEMMRLQAEMRRKERQKATMIEAFDNGDQDTLLAVLNQGGHFRVLGLPSADRDSFEPREWTPAEMSVIERQAVVHEQMEAGQRFTRWREFSVRSTSDCPHTSGTMVDIANKHGIWTVVLCNDCGGYQSPPTCAHVRCSWHLDGKVLICDNCGIDGT